MTTAIERARPVSATAYLAVFVLAALIILMRSLDTFIHPIAGWEDATQGINTYIHAGSPIFHAYAGYISVLPNIIDFLSVKSLPLPFVPYAQAWFALSMAATIAPAALAFFHHMLAWPTRIAAPIALVIACLPLADVAIVSNTEFSIWAMLAALLLALANPVPNRTIRAGTYISWRILFAASIPLSIIAVPVWLALAIIHRRQLRAASIYLLLSATTLAYAVWCTAHANILALTMAQVANILAATIKMVSEKSLLAITIRGILGINLHTPPIWALTATICAATAALIYIHAAAAPTAPKPFWKSQRPSPLLSPSRSSVSSAAAPTMPPSCSIHRVTTMSPNSFGPSQSPSPPSISGSAKPALLGASQPLL